MKIKFVRVSTWLLSTAMTFLGLSVCGCNPFDSPVEYGTPHADFIVSGKVVNAANKPIPGIQVALKEYSKEYSTDSIKVVTNSKGEFSQKLIILPQDKDFRLSFKDIDGAKNGLYKYTFKILKFKTSELSGSSGWYSGKVEKSVTVVMDDDVQ